MRVWSRGLGRVELAADLKRVKIFCQDDVFYIVGKSEPPASWDFVVTIDSSEIWPIVRLMMNKSGIAFFSKYAKLRLFNQKQLHNKYEKATKTRTGIKPEHEYAPILTKMKTLPSSMKPKERVQY